MSAQAAADEKSGIFAGLSFFVLQRIPSRQHYISEITKHGGTIVRLENQATYIIADDARKDQPPGSISWKFIEEASKQGLLPDVELYRIASSAAGAARPVGSTVVAAQRTRKVYTRAEGEKLSAYVCQALATTTRFGPFGKPIYQAFAADNPEHPWQSWRDHYIKYYKDRDIPTIAALKSRLAEETAQSPRATADTDIHLLRGSDNDTSTRSGLSGLTAKSNTRSEANGSRSPKAAASAPERPPSIDNARTARAAANTDDKLLASPKRNAVPKEKITHTNTTHGHEVRPQPKTKDTATSEAFAEASTATPTATADASYSKTPEASLDLEQQGLLKSVLAREPRDMHGNLFTELEISHLILNMSDLLDLDDDDLGPWEQWADAMESKKALDWRELYRCHILAEVARAGKKRQLCDPVSEDSRHDEGILSDRPQDSRLSKETTQYTSLAKRKAYSPLKGSPAKRAMASKEPAQLIAVKPAHAERTQHGHRDELEDTSSMTNALCEAIVTSRQMSSQQKGGIASEALRIDDDHGTDIRNDTATTTTQPHSSSLEMRMPVPQEVASQPNRSTMQEAFTTATGGSTQFSATFELDLGIPSPSSIHETTDSIHTSQASKSTNAVPDSFELSLGIPSPPGSDGSVEEEEQLEMTPSRLSVISESQESLDLDLTVPSPGMLSNYNQHDNRDSEPLYPEAKHTQQWDTQAILDAQTQIPDLGLELPMSGSSFGSPPPREQSSTRRQHARQSDVASTRVGSELRERSSPGRTARLSVEAQDPEQAFFAMLGRQIARGWSRKEVQQTIYDCSGRTALAEQVLQRTEPGRSVDSNADWRWTSAEDEVLVGTDARALSALEKKHGHHEFTIRSMFLNDMIDSQ